MIKSTKINKSPVLKTNIPIFLNFIILCPGLNPTSITCQINFQNSYKIFVFRNYVSQFLLSQNLPSLLQQTIWPNFFGCFQKKLVGANFTNFFQKKIRFWDLIMLQQLNFETQFLRLIWFVTRQFWRNHVSNL